LLISSFGKLAKGAEGARAFQKTNEENIMSHRRCGLNDEDLLWKDLVAHKNAAHDMSEFRGKECSSVFGYETALKRHVRSKHEGKRLTRKI
jgi:hypothetical protein